MFGRRITSPEQRPNRCPILARYSTEHAAASVLAATSAHRSGSELRHRDGHLPWVARHEWLGGPDRFSAVKRWFDQLGTRPAVWRDAGPQIRSDRCRPFRAGPGDCSKTHKFLPIFGVRRIGLMRHAPMSDPSRKDRQVPSFARSGGCDQRRYLRDHSRAAGRHQAGARPVIRGHRPAAALPQSVRTKRPWWASCSIRIRDLRCGARLTCPTS